MCEGKTGLVLTFTFDFFLSFTSGGRIEMSDRQQIQRNHELVVMKRFVEQLGSSEGVHYELVMRPDPPDGIFKSADKTIWLEVADVYRSADEAHEERSRVTSGESGFVHRESPIAEPDERLAIAMLDLIENKISKESYRSVFLKYGPGILICCERDPLFDESTVRRIDSRLKEKIPVLEKADKGFFKEVYVYVAGWTKFGKLCEFTQIE